MKYFRQYGMRFIIFCMAIVLLAGCSQGGGADTEGTDSQIDEEENTKNNASDETEITQTMEEDDNEMKSITVWDVINEMTIGWNLGNTLDATNSTALKAGSPLLWETAWGNPETTEELIHTVIDNGFNVIRIPVSWNDHLYVNEDYKIEESWMDRVQEVVDYAYDYGAYVILNTHHESWYYPYYENEEKASEIMTAVWTQIAERFADYDEHLIFEGMNEPRKIGTDVEWTGGDSEGWAVVNSLNEVFVNTVRAAGGNNKYRMLMVTGYAANCWTAIKHLEIPDDDRLIVSVHAYEPYDFALNLNGRGEWNQATEDIDSIMTSLNELFISKGIPVIIGEFGAVSKDVEGNEEERAAWAEYYVSAAKEIGVPCVWWDNGLFEGEGECLGLINRETYECEFPLVLEGLYKGLQTNIDYSAGIVNEGSSSRLMLAMEKAENGGEVTIGFIGGSITQGSLASDTDSCYAYLVYQWWQEKFPDSTVNYLNAGIGATTSQFGAARAEQDLLAYSPDVVVVEYSVNDSNDSFFKETYEGLIRKILQSEGSPAVVLLHNIMYSNGWSSEQIHSAVGTYYDLPCLSMQSSVYPLIQNGTILTSDISPDGLHPNDAGHEMTAELVISYLEQVYSTMGQEEETDKSEELPAALTDNAYENAVRYQNCNSSPNLDGFTADTSESTGITDLFKNGWTSSQVGDSITFEVTGTEIAVQYRKSIQKPACIAEAVIDGDEANAIVLDGNFNETWGDSLYLENALYHGENGTHTVKITITEAEGDPVTPFYLVSLIVSE